MSSEPSLLVIGGGRPGSPPPCRAASSARRSPCSNQARSAGPASIAVRRRCGRWPARPGSRVTGPPGPPSGWTGRRRCPNLPAVHGQQRTGGPLRPRQEGHGRPPAPARDRPGGGPRAGRLRRPAHGGRRRPRTWSADRIIVAVGGHAGRLRIPGAELALTYEDIPSLTSLPGRVAVVGGADTGCQMASIFEDFGISVALFEAGPSLIPAADASVSAELDPRLPRPGHERAHADAGRGAQQ